MIKFHDDQCLVEVNSSDRSKMEKRCKSFTNINRTNNKHIIQEIYSQHILEHLFV